VTTLIDFQTVPASFKSLSRCKAACDIFTLDMMEKWVPVVKTMSVEEYDDRVENGRFQACLLEDIQKAEDEGYRRVKENE